MMTSSGNSSNISTIIGSTTYITSQDIAFSTLYSFIVFFGVVGNGIVITIVRKTPSMHTTTNYLLINLAVADLLSLLFCPGFYDFALHDVKLKQTVGDFVCKVFAGNAVLSVTVLESIFTLTVVAVERYFSLVKTFNTSARLRKENVGYAIAATWILACTVCFPGFLSNNYDENATKYPCNRPWTLDKLVPLKKTYIITFCFLFMITPTFVILFCYFAIFYGIRFKRNICRENPGEVAKEQSKKRLLKLLVSLAVAFVVCCSPFAAFFIYIGFISQSTLNQRYNTLHLAHRSVRFLLILNSFINPLLYAAQSSNYRQGLRRICRLSQKHANETISNRRVFEKHQELVELEQPV
ncbi:hypothetical protein OS493_019685 [Desmophyllum pertusum]|uniref:G-protein coupled receptors family 1 profile domain-containing protein n=2 Tax=Desmophyllum pertusum TaxID=174260 RepID=A0A9W9YZ85_9CNID|nr:hypothetical protein OS493_019685 [Desmophyllum pertusum]